MTDPSLSFARQADADAPRGPGRGAPPYPGAFMAVAAGAALTYGLAGAFGGMPVMALALMTFLAGSAVAVAGLSRGYPHAEFGPANAVTMVRLSLVGVLVGALAGGGAGGWGVPGIAAAALALDGVDGWLARRSGLASRYGARFDMEVDCGLALVLALLALDGGKVGAWVLALGLARYAFWAATLALPWLDGDLPERRSRKAVCVVQIVALIAVLAPPVAAPLASALAAGALAFVGWSFALDIRHLHRVRP